LKSVGKDSTNPNFLKSEGSLMRKLLLSAFALALCVGGVVAMSARPADSVSGWVIDAKCSANKKMLGNVDCAKKCEAAGSKLVVVSDAGGKVYAVDNQDALHGHEGHHVTVDGTISGDSLHVDKVTMMKDQTPPGK